MNEQLIKDLREWLLREKNSHSKLAAKLGYKSGSVIFMWLYRNSIPEYQASRVERIIKTKGKKNEQVKSSCKG